MRLKGCSVTILLITALMFNGVSIYGQKLQQNAVGLKAGIGLTDEINNLYGASSTIGYQINGFYSRKFTDRLSARLEAGFIQKGFASEVYFPGVNEEESYTTTYNYLTLGPDLVLSFPNPGKTIYFFGGIRTDYFLGYTSSDEFEQLFIKPVAEDFHKFQLLVNAGTGISLPSGLFIELNGNIDVLNKIKKQENTDTSPRFFDVYFGVNVGWKMNI